MANTLAFAVTHGYGTQAQCGTHLYFNIIRATMTANLIYFCGLRFVWADPQDHSSWAHTDYTTGVYLNFYFCLFSILLRLNVLHFIFTCGSIAHMHSINSLSKYDFSFICMLQYKHYYGLKAKPFDSHQSSPQERAEKLAESKACFCKT